MYNLTIPEFKVGMMVLSPCSHSGITADKKYIIEGIHHNTHIIIRNDEDRLTPYRVHMFIEADLYFTICFYMTLISLFNLATKSYK